ncbi:putative OPA3-like protein CG13603 [Solenopsis invicta]|uniref:putative OPA3-like protein CG13603 n=1 Tax=Solenopsis invicta TaxID=13686 RepID=UPI000596236C|nr:putative OPA3-like protein CG13603 [Solenopsis invicta]
MMMQGFPGANLIGLILRRFTQPLSKAIVRRVKKQPLLRKYVLIQLGRFYYWCENMIKWQEIPGKKRPVNDEHTMELGTTLLLETLVFGLLCSVLIYETQKAAEKSRVAEQLKIQKLNDLETEKNRLMQRVQDQVILAKQLKDFIVNYSKQVGCTLPSDPEEEKSE